MAATESITTSMATVKFVATLLHRRRYYETETSSSSDDEYEMALRERGKRKLRTRIVGYDDVVRRYTDYEFKSHFRLVSNFCFFQIFNITVLVLNALYFQSHLQLLNKNN